MMPSAVRTFSVLLLIISLLRIILFGLLPHGYYVISADALAYFNQASHPWISPALWAGSRPMGYPLVIKLLGHQLALIFTVQLLISIIAWSYAAFVAANSGQGIWRWVAVVGIILTACSSYVIVWDIKLLTESLSFSFVVLCIASAIACLQSRFSRLPMVLFCLSVLCAAIMRDSNAYLVLALTVLLAGSALLGRQSKPHIITVLIAGVISALIAMSTANIGQRWRVPMGDLFTGRVLETPVLLNYFIRSGMPTDQLRAIEYHAQQIPLDMARDVYGQQITQADTPLGDWFATRSKTTYETFLLSHPGYSFSPLFNTQYWMTLLISDVNFALYLTYNNPTLYHQYQDVTQHGDAFYRSNHDVVSAWPINVVLKWLYRWCSLFDFAIIVTALYQLIRHYRRALNAGICFCWTGCVTVIIPLGLIVWLAEPMEVFRHQLGNHITLILLLCYLIALPTRHETAT